jgi:hypothetical protein
MILPPLTQEEATSQVIAILTRVDDPNVALNVQLQTTSAILASLDVPHDAVIDTYAGHLKVVTAKIVAKGAELAEQEKAASPIITLE